MPLATVVIFFFAAATVVCLTIVCGRRQNTIVDLNHDITEERNALHLCERHHDFMFSVNPYPMWVFDRSTLRFLDVNDAAVEAYGYSREEFLSMKVTDLRPPEDVPGFVEAIRTHQPGCVRPGIFRHRRKD